MQMSKLANTLEQANWQTYHTWGTPEYIAIDMWVVRKGTPCPQPLQV
jgi:hypothetical protein